MKERSNRKRRRAPRIAITPVLWVVLTASVAAAEPLSTLRDFCRRDGLGERLLQRTWDNIAPLVSWRLEPAWDHVYLIEGYKIGTPRREEDETTAIDVVYVVTGEVRGGEVTTTQRNEQRTYRLGRAEGEDWWRIAGPPPPPYVFATQVNADDMAASLDQYSGDFLTDSAFVWQMLKDADIFVPRFSVSDVSSLKWLMSESRGKSGDMVVYSDGDRPYHVGLLEEKDTVVSATLNGGVRRTQVDAFTGTVTYWRLRPDWATVVAQTPTPGAGDVTSTPAETPTPVIAPPQQEGVSGSQESPPAPVPTPAAATDVR